MPTLVVAVWAVDLVVAVLADREAYAQVKERTGRLVLIGRAIVTLFNYSVS